MAITRQMFLTGGPSSIKLAPYVDLGADADAGDLVDMGKTEGGVQLAISHTDFEAKVDQFCGTVDRFPTDSKVTIKFVMTESELEHWRVALRQPAGNLTEDSGPPLTKTLLVGQPEQQYYQLLIVGPGKEIDAANAKTRTIRAFKAVVETVEELSMVKDNRQMVGVTMDVLLDLTVSTAGKRMKVLDA